MTTTQHTTQIVAALKLRRQEAGQALALARRDTDLWLEMMAEAVYREKAYLQNKGDVADGELAAPWNLLTESIQRLRRAQENLATLTRQIEQLEEVAPA